MGWGMVIHVCLCEMELSFINKNYQSELWKEEKLYSGEQFTNLGNAVSGGNYKCRLLKRKFPPWFLWIFMQMRNPNYTVLIDPNGMVLIDQNCLFWLVSIYANNTDALFLLDVAGLSPLVKRWCQELPYKDWLRIQKHCAGGWQLIL